MLNFYMAQNNKKDQKNEDEKSGSPFRRAPAQQVMGNRAGEMLIEKEPEREVQISKKQKNVQEKEPVKTNKNRKKQKNAHGVTRGRKTYLVVLVGGIIAQYPSLSI